jgi:ribosomal protein L7/L12
MATSQYGRDPELTVLPSVVEDAAGLREVLAHPQIGNFSVTTCLESSSQDCRECIEDFFSEGLRDELLLLYITGHGVKDADGELYFAVQNTLTSRLRATGIASSFIKDVAKRSKARGIVTILDTCFSGAFASRDPKGAQVGVAEHFRESRGRVVITATDSFQHALGSQTSLDQRVRPSLFSSHVIQGLKTGEADVDGDGEVSSKDLYDYVLARMQGSGLRPQRWEFGCDLHLAASPRASATTLPKPVIKLMNETDADMRLVAVRELARLLIDPSASVAVALAARLALEGLQSDDNQKVSTEAVSVLARERSQQTDPQMVVVTEADSEITGTKLEEAGSRLPAEETTEFNVVLRAYPANKKIMVIKVIREIAGLGLYDAKVLVESTPSIVKEGVSKADSETIRQMLEKAGAKVEVRASAGETTDRLALAERKTQFTVVLKEYPARKKIMVIKVIREITGLGLYDAKVLVDGVPSIVKEAVSKADSETIRKVLEEAGAIVEVM